MRLPVLLAACCLAFTAAAGAGRPHRPSPGEPPPNGGELLPAKASKAFTRCMRKHYGPHYYRGVTRAHRFFMAQACGG